MQPCTHRPTCPGCPRYGEPGVAAEPLGKLTAVATAAGLAPPAVIEGPALAFRQRARLAVRGRARSPKIGLFQEGSHRIADIPRCGVHHPLINRVVDALKQAIRETATPPYAESGHRGLLRYVQIVVSSDAPRAQVVLITNSEDETSTQPLARALEARLGDALHSLHWNGNPGTNNSIIGPSWTRLTGPEALVESMGGVPVFFPPGAFGQANLTLFRSIRERIDGCIPDGADVAELYAGVGAIGVPFLDRVRSLHLNESGAHSLRGLALSLAARPEAVRARAQVHPGDAGEQWLGDEGMRSCDHVIIDPPRRGADAKLIEALAERPPRQLIYLSCGVESFVEQAAQLQAHGRLRLVELEAYALFPYTSHIETLARFVRD